MDSANYASITSVILTRFIGRDTLNIDVAKAGNLGIVKVLGKQCGSAGGNCVIGLKCLDELRQIKFILCYN